MIQREMETRERELVLGTGPYGGQRQRVLAVDLQGMER